MIRIKPRCQTCAHRDAHRTKPGETVLKWCQRISRWVHPRGSCPHYSVWTEDYCPKCGRKIEVRQ